MCRNKILILSIFKSLKFSYISFFTTFKYFQIYFHQYVLFCSLPIFSYLFLSIYMYFVLQPSNIFFSYDGVIKIGDFGLVTDLTQEEVEECSNDFNPFRKHTAQVGTTLYMSPEQVRQQLTHTHVPS